MFLPRCLATGIGSLPHLCAEAAVELIARWLPEAPFWPQLPQRGPEEGMCRQFLTGLPGWVGDHALQVDPGTVTVEQRTTFFQRAFLQLEEGWPLDADRTAGYAAWLKRDWPAARLFKGQVTGPITLGLALTDLEDKPVLYHGEMMELVSSQLRQLARGQEHRMAAHGARAPMPTLVFIDEPWLAAYGSAFAAFGRDEVIRYLSWVMEGIEGLKAVHCCGNTDWSVILDTPLDVLSFDAYGFGDKVMLFATELAAFLQRGGYLAWGIVPSEGTLAQEESVSSLVERLLTQLEALARRGWSVHRVLERSFITPACGLGNQSPEAAERIIELTAETAVRLQELCEGGR